jgi:hypothetical protein
VTAADHWWTLSLIIASVVLLPVRLCIRLSSAESLLAPAIAAARTPIAGPQWTRPVIHLVHLAALLASVLGQRFAWAGIGYRLTGRAVTIEWRTGEA